MVTSPRFAMVGFNKLKSWNQKVLTSNCGYKHWFSSTTSRFFIPRTSRAVTKHKSKMYCRNSLQQSDMPYDCHSQRPLQKGLGERWKFRNEIKLVMWHPKDDQLQQIAMDNMIHSLCFYYTIYSEKS